MPRKHGHRKKRRTHVDTEAQFAATGEAIPRSFVVKKGRCDASVADLVKDLRNVMQPHTAARLKERRDNSVKDYVNLAGSFKVTHLAMMTQTDANVNWKVGRMPNGPTLSFRVMSYSLMRNVRSLQKHPLDPTALYNFSPLVILNNFGESLPSTPKQLSLCATMFRGMFPAVDVGDAKLSQCRRVVLFHYDKEKDLIEFRHYGVRVVAAGLSRGVKAVVRGKRIPNLSKAEDVADLVTGGAGLGDASDSEMEEEVAKVDLSAASHVTGTLKASGHSAVRLSELGPRMTLKLVKVEAGLAAGDVLYHAFVHKTQAEIVAAAQARKEKEQAAAAAGKKPKQTKKRERRGDDSTFEVVKSAKPVDEDEDEDEFDSGSAADEESDASNDEDDEDDEDDE